MRGEGGEREIRLDYARAFHVAKLAAKLPGADSRDSMLVSEARYTWWARMVRDGAVIAVNCSSPVVVRSREMTLLTSSLSRPNNNCRDERPRVISVAIIAGTKRRWRGKFSVAIQNHALSRRIVFRARGGGVNLHSLLPITGRARRLNGLIRP